VLAKLLQYLVSFVSVSLSISFSRFRGETFGDMPDRNPGLVRSCHAMAHTAHVARESRTCTTWCGELPCKLKSINT